MTILGINIAVGNPIYQRRGSPPVITATTAPTLSALTDAQTPADGYTAGSYLSSATGETESTGLTVTTTYIVNDVEVLGTYDLDAGDVVEVRVVVSDSASNSKPFSTGTVTVTAAPAGVQNQTAPFGANTLSGAGGYQITNASGSPITNATDAGTGTATGYAVSAGGIITPSSDGGLAAQDGATIDISCDQGTATVTLAVEANARDIAPTDNLEIQLESATIAFGDTIYLRDGTYGTADVARASAPMGTFTAPSDKTPSHQGPDLDTGNYAHIRARNAGQVMVNDLWAFSNANGGCHGFRISGIVFDRPVPAELRPLGSPDSSPILRFEGGAYNFAVDGCTFRSSTDATGDSDTYTAIRNQAANGAGIKIIDNTFEDVWIAYVGGSGGQDGLDIIGNTMTRCWNDCIKFNQGSNIRIHWNEMREKKTPVSNVGAHPDYIQYLGGSSSEDNISILYNRIGEGSEASDGQGIFLDDTDPGFALTNVVIAGNIGVCGYARGISVTRGVDPIIVHNTLVGNGANQTAIILDPNGAPDGTTDGFGGDVRYNISENFSIGQATANSGNVVADFDAASGDAAYSTIFDSPAVTSSLTEIETQLAGKSGGPADLDVPSGAAGWGFIDFATRTANLPALEAPAFSLTDVTDATISTVYSASAQITGVGASGAAVHVSGGNSPEIRILDTDNATVVRDWSSADALVGNNQYLYVRDTSSGSGSITTDVTVLVGQTAETWSITTAGVTGNFVGAKSTVLDATLGYPQTISLTGLSGGIASSAAEGDLVIVSIVQGSSTSRTTTFPVGWTALTHGFANATDDCNLDVAYKIMGATPDTTVEISGSNSTGSASVLQVRVYRNVDGTTPMDVAAVGTDGTNTIAANPGSITPTTTGATLVFIGAATAGLGRTGVAFSHPDLSNLSQVRSEVTARLSLIAGGDMEWAGGAVDLAAFTPSVAGASGDSWCAYALALRPA